MTTGRINQGAAASCSLFAHCRGRPAVTLDFRAPRALAAALPSSGAGDTNSPGARGKMPGREGPLSARALPRAVLGLSGSRGAVWRASLRRTAVKLRAISPNFARRICDVELD